MCGATPTPAREERGGCAVRLLLLWLDRMAGKLGDHTASKSPSLRRGSPGVRGRGRSGRNVDCAECKEGLAGVATLTEKQRMGVLAASAA